MKAAITDLLLAIQQMILSFLAMAGLLGLIFIIVSKHATLDKDVLALLTGLAGVLGTIVTQQNGYFFQRQRPHLITDPDDDAPRPRITSLESTSTTTTTAATPAPLGAKP